MDLQFKALSVLYLEALDGAIAQVIFEENPDGDIEDSTLCHLCLSICYEFPPATLDAQWCDGNELNGGRDVMQYSLSETRLSLLLDNQNRITVHFQTDNNTYKKLSRLLLQEWGMPEKQLSAGFSVGQNRKAIMH